MNISKTSFTIINSQAELNIYAKGISSEDALTLKKTSAEFGITSSGSALMFMHKGLIADKWTVEFFNVNLSDRTFIKKSQRNLLKVLLIDDRTNILKCVKIVTLNDQFVEKLA